jgi:hypothetical protein
MSTLDGKAFNGKLSGNIQGSKPVPLTTTTVPVQGDSVSSSTSAAWPVGSQRNSVVTTVGSVKLPS